ncbi:DUF4082 domain-containing protein [Microbacterium deminutum]|uniref:DUF4082 domain-containing protein n=1 Tax=Microbacterium deminutum TaxID=344164 RepID=A0ABP5BYU9_9MICO
MALAVMIAATFVVFEPAVPAATAAGSSCGATINPIVCENSKPGTDPSVWDIQGAGDSDIQGFATDISVNAGSKIDFKIDTSARAYKIDIYRTGYYQGLGARYITSVTPSVTLPQTQPQCISDVSTELYDCGTWGVSASWNVPSDAVSGVYIAKLSRTDNDDDSHIIFIVRNDSSSADVVFQTSDPTWQAYNTYGGSDLYQGAANGRAYKISYNRPFATRRDNSGRDFYFSGEFATVQFLERNGYDMTYIAGVDTDRSGSLLRNHKVFLSVGHDEYWSSGQRANVQAARDAGVNLQFLSGNEIYWHTRYEKSVDGSNTPYRTLVSYKETWANAKIDPSTEWTGTWRDPRFTTAANGGTMPENALSGTMYVANSDDLPVTVTAGQGKTRLWRNTSLTSLAAGTSQALANHTVGYESDEDFDNGFRPAGLIQLSTTIGSTPQYLADYGNTVVPGTTAHHVTLYKATSGALVFSAATIQWGWGLDQNHDGKGAAADPRMQQAQVNLLADMGAQPATLMSELAPATATTDITAPTTVIASPAAGAAIANGTLVTVTGTASDAGGVVAGVEVSTDAGSTWHPATGTTAWSYTYIQQGSGAGSIKARAIDDSANFSVAGVTANITVTGPYSAMGNAAPAVASANDTSAVEVGLEFRPTMDGFVTGVRFYKGAANTGTHVGSLWDTTTGQRLGQVTFGNESATGWQTASFASALTVTGGHNYTVSYSAPSGGYAATNLYWPYQAQASSPVAVAPGVGTAAPGVYGAVGSMPTSNNQEGNYFVDVVFVQTDNSPLRLAASTPLAGSSSNLSSAAITATISRSVVASTVAMTVKDAAGASASGTVSYDPTSRTATFTPTSTLLPDTTYTATVTATDSAGIGFSGGNSWSFKTAAATLPAGTCPCQLFPDASAPDIGSAADTASVTLGVRFTTTQSGTITALRFYRGTANVGAHTGTLWSASGSALATVTYSGESTRGWQTATLAQPVSVTAGAQYVASYTAPGGGYAVSAGQFSSPYSRGPLSVDAGGSVYSYSGGFPASNSTAGYGVDVVFLPNAAGPVLTSSSPADGATGVASSSTISGTFDTAISAATIAVTSGGTAIAGSTGWSSDGKTFTFTPATALPSDVIVAVSVTSITGSNGATAADASWSFETAAVGGVQAQSFFSGGPVTAPTATGDANAVILGMSFTTSDPGQVRAIRFYKAPSNTGTHVGWLWGSGSTTPLATVTFTGETASGWQRAALSTPVELTTGQTYTVSYLAPKGNYSYQAGGFASALTSGSLTAGSPNNGVYLYGTSGKPTATYNSTNYFVDVEFIKDTVVTQTLWDSSVIPTDATTGDTDPVELGTAMTVDVEGQVTALRFFKDATNTGTHVGSLWSSDGTKLASVSFSSETSSGWQRAALSTPVTIEPGQTYIVSYFAPNGRYSRQLSYFAAPKVSGHISGQNGLFLYGASGGFPTNSFQSSAYFVDAEIAFGSSGSAGISPAVSATSPASGAANVDPSTVMISATLTNATSASLAVTTGGAGVAGTSSFNSATGVVSFTPTAALGWSKSYSVTVTANGGSVTNGSWLFTTTAQPVGPAITTITPASGASNVDPATASISATLTNATSASLALTTGGAGVAGTSSFNATTGVVTFTPSSALGYGKTYSVVTTANATAVSGGAWSFTTTPAATLTSVTPASAATNVDPATVKITATLANATAGTIVLRAGTTTIAGTSAFNASSEVVTFTPTAALGWTTTYTATVTANSGNVTNGTWSFTTMAKQDQVSLFTTGAPTNANTTAVVTMDIGTRFKTSAAGVVTAIKFYKGSLNTGTHTGYLWSATGSKLATVTFTGESASGWQAATLSTPVRLTVGAEYRVSMFSTSRIYAVTTGGLSAVVTSGPISTIATGGAYALTNSFPNTTSTNKYWVDVVFDPDN